MKPLSILFVFLVAAQIPVGCSSDKKANALFVKSCQVFEQARDEATYNSYSKSLELYLKALEKIETILEHYPSTEIAVGLVSDNLRINGYTLDEFRRFRFSLQQKAAPETQPVYCAFRIASNIQDFSFRVRALRQILVTLPEAESDENLISFIPDIISTMGDLNDPWLETLVMLDLVNTYIEFEMHTEAMAILANVEEEARVIKEQDTRAHMLAQIALVYHQIDSTDISTRIFEELELTLTQFQDTYERMETTAEVAEYLAKTGYHSDVSNLLGGLLEEISSFTEAEQYQIFYSRSRENLYDIIARSYIANDQLNKAEDTAQLIWNKYERSRILLSLVDSYIGIEDTSKAELIQEGLRSLILEQDLALGWSHILAQLAETYHQLGQHKTATELLNEAEMSLISADVSWHQAGYLLEISDAYWTIDENNAALDALFEAIISTKLLHNATDKSTMFVQIALQLSKIWMKSDEYQARCMHQVVSFLFG